MGSASPVPTWQLGPSIQPSQPTPMVPLRHVKLNCLDIRQDVGGAGLADAMGYDLIRTGPGPHPGIHTPCYTRSILFSYLLPSPAHWPKKFYFTCISEVGLHARSRKKVDGTLLPALFFPSSRVPLGNFPAWLSQLSFIL